MASNKDGRMRSRRGNTILEFALVFFPFVLLTLGLIEGGLLLFNYHSLCHAAREGARFAVVHGEANPVKDAAITQVIRDNAIGMPADAIAVATTWEPDKSRGSAVRIQASYQYRFLLSSLIFPGDGFTLRTTSRMTVFN